MNKMNRMRPGAANPNNARESKGILTNDPRGAVRSVPGEKVVARDSSCSFSSADELSRLSGDRELGAILNKDADVRSLAYVLREHAHRNNFDVISLEKVMDLALQLGMNKKAVVRAVEILRDAGYVGTCGVNDKSDFVCVNPKLAGARAPVHCLTDQPRTV